MTMRSVLVRWSVCFHRWRWHHSGQISLPTEWYHPSGGYHLGAVHNSYTPIATPLSVRPHLHEWQRDERTRQFIFTTPWSPTWNLQWQLEVFVIMPQSQCFIATAIWTRYVQYGSPIEVNWSELHLQAKCSVYSTVLQCRILHSGGNCVVAPECLKLMLYHSLNITFSFPEIGPK